MTYDQSDLETLERNAYQRGDTLVADLAASAMDNAQAAERVDALIYTLERLQEMADKAGYRTAKKSELRDLLDEMLSNIRDTLSEGE